MRRRKFGPKRDEVTGEWRKLHIEELRGLYCSPNTVWVIKSRRMRWVGHVARMGERRGVYRCGDSAPTTLLPAPVSFLINVTPKPLKGFWWGNLRERDHLGDPGVDGRVILTLNLPTTTVVPQPFNFIKWQLKFNPVA